MGPLEKPLVLPLGPGETAFLVAEDFTFDQVGRDRTAIDREEGTGAAPAQVVHSTGHQLFAGTALAGNEHGDRRTRHTGNLLIHQLHRFGHTDQVAKAAGAQQVFIQSPHLGMQHRRLRHA